ncbi:hypothetical protein J437_LFUL000659, partial [Ladona fulva]
FQSSVIRCTVDRSAGEGGKIHRKSTRSLPCDLKKGRSEVASPRVSEGLRAVAEPMSPSRHSTEGKLVLEKDSAGGLRDSGEY